MRENYELFKKEINDLKALCLKALISSDITDIDEDGFKALQGALRIVDTSLKFTEAQVATMERLEEKLDKLLAKE